MQEHDIRLLFDAGQIAGARVVVGSNSEGWNVILVFEGDRPEQVLHAKRGGRRVFKTSDAALVWCREIGLKSVKVQLASGCEHSKVRKPKQSEQILLVEDNEDDITLTLRVFRKNRISNEIVVKRDGQEALDYLFRSDNDERSQASLPALVLLDLNLPKINGLEVLREIRNHASTHLLPVVILTTSDEPEDICQGYNLGSNSYLRKPADINRFSDMLTEIGQYWVGLNTSPPELR